MARRDPERTPRVAGGLATWLGWHEGWHRLTIGVRPGRVGSSGRLWGKCPDSYGTIQSRAVMIAIGINDKGRRCIVGVELAERESRNDAAWQRCYVHFLRNALDYLPRRGDHDCLHELRWIYGRRDVGEARRGAIWRRG